MRIRKRLSVTNEDDEKNLKETGKDLSAPVKDNPKYEQLMAANLVLAAPGRFLEDPKLSSLMTEASYDLYRQLDPSNPQKAMMALLAVSVTNASLDCIAQAMRTPATHLQLREINLRHGMKGAKLAAYLLKAMNDLHGQKTEKVTVGNVNIEAGGQAIVGTVEAAGSSKGPEK
jgi:alkylhydroperoxidase family enzyme